MALHPHISLLKGGEVGASEGVVERLRPVTVQEHWRQKEEEEVMMRAISSPQSV